jgi:hypothetical protein
MPQPQEKDQKQPPVEQPKPASIDNETRVDDFAIEQFRAMGHSTVLPDLTVKIYKEFKQRKDRLHPGRLSPEGFVFVDMLSRMISGELKF